MLAWVHRLWDLVAQRLSLSLGPCAAPALGLFMMHLNSGCLQEYKLQVPALALVRSGTCVHTCQSATRAGLTWGCLGCSGSGLV